MKAYKPHIAAYGVCYTAPTTVCRLKPRFEAFGVLIGTIIKNNSGGEIVVMINQTF